MLRVMQTITMSMLCLALMAGSSFAQTPVKPADFYKGKTVQLIVGENPGGNTDLTGRLVAKYMQKQLGATVVVLNKPGAAHLEAYNYLWHAKPDGLTIGCEEFSSMVANDLMDEPGIQYQADKYTYIGSIGDEAPIFYVNAKGPIKSVQDLKALKGGKLGATSPAGGRTLDLVTAAYCLDLDAKVIPGFPGDKAITLAVLQGEVDGTATSVGSYLRGFQGGTHRGLFTADNRRSKGAPDIPSLTEIAQLPTEKSDFLKLRVTARANWTFYAPPGTPEERIAFLRATFNEIIKQNDFKADIEKLWYPNVEFLDGKTVAERAGILKSNKKLWQDRWSVLFAKYRPL